jgi:hypothetical protein
VRRARAKHAVSVAAAALDLAVRGRCIVSLGNASLEVRLARSFHSFSRAAFWKRRLERANKVSNKLFKLKTH